MDLTTHEAGLAPHLASTSGLKQPYHLVDPSPWPIVGAAGGGLLLAGIVFAAHFGAANRLYDLPLLAGFLIVLLTMFMWWKDVLREASQPGLHSPIVSLGLRYGMTLFISSEVMFFVGFFWAFFHYAIYPEHVAGATTPMWPPAGIHTFDPFRIPFLNTMILLLSGCTVTWSHHALLVNNRRHLIMGLGVTVLLGMTFTCLQALEYSEAPFHFAGGGIYPSIFFLATGFHGFHVIIGTCFLVVCWMRARGGGFTPAKHFGFEAAAWYWHFVDVVWLFLFIFIYVWGAGPPAIE
jgi:cytochrome c oxidase subunit 3